MSRYHVRPARIVGDVAFIPLTRGYEATVDVTDLPLVEGRNWCALVTKRRKAIYACRGEEISGVCRHVMMHRVIAGTPDGMDTDHIDGNGLNNRRSNLRICTRAENVRNVARRSDNTSGFKGVTFKKKLQKWVAEINADGRRRYLGLFDTAEEAHQTYVAAAAALHGDFARPE